MTALWMVLLWLTAGRRARMAYRGRHHVIATGDPEWGAYLSAWAARRRTERAWA